MRVFSLCLLVPALLTGCEGECVDADGRFNLACAGARFHSESYCCDSLAALGDVNGDGFDDVLIGGTGGGYLFFGPIYGNTDLSHADVVFATSGIASVASAGDVNGDGNNDVLVGSGRNVRLIPGPFDETTSFPAAQATLNGSAGLDYRRFKAVGAGDVNADGYDDVLIGTSFLVVEEDCQPSLLRDCSHYEGETHIFFGPLNGTLLLSDADASLIGEDGGHQVAAAGDFNADGFDDILVGMSRFDSCSGAAFLFLGPVSGSLTFEDAGAVFNGCCGQRVGSSLSSAGDVDADGYDDILIGSLYSERAYLVRGPVSGTFNLYGAGTRFIGGFSGFSVGREMAGVGDVDGDGLVDLLLGECHHDSGANLHGAAYLVRGPASGKIEMSKADVEFRGRKWYSNLGRAVSGAGDVDGDGLGDFLIGSPGSGEAYLIYGW